MKAMVLNARCKLRSFITNEKAASILEFAILIIVVVALAVIVVNNIQSKITSKVNQASDDLDQILGE